MIAGRAIAATLMQAFAPVLGGYLQGWFGWRCNFVVIAVIACIAMALVTRYVPEGPRQPPCKSRSGGMLASYRTLIGTRRFISYAFTAAGSHAGFHIFAAGAPAVLIVGLGIRPEDYGFYASLPPMGFLIGSFLSNRLSRRLGIDGLITIGCTVLIPAASIMVTLAVLGVASPYAVIGPMILICCGSGLITPNATAGSLGVNAGIVGTASGLGSFMQMTGAAGATALLSLGPSGSPMMLAGIIAVAGLFAVTAFYSLIQLDHAPRASRRDSLVAVMDAPATSRAPAGWSPQRAIATCFPAMFDFYQAVQPDIRAIEGRLDRDEARGLDTSCLRQALRELRWRLEYTSDVAGARANLERIQSLASLPAPPCATSPDEEGSYGACTEVWFLKLDASVDHLLAPDFKGKPPRFLDRINDPDRLGRYLEGLLVSRLAEEGVDHRKELNFATANLVRLILWRRPANYRWDPRLDPIIRRFVANWQDPATGFFGATYEIGGQRFRTTDLSLTFHMARYFEGKSATGRN